MLLREFTDFPPSDKLSLLEDRLDDLQARYRFLKSKRDQLNKDAQSLMGFIPMTKREREYEQRRRKEKNDRWDAMPRDELEREYHADVARGDRKKRIRASVSTRIIELNHQLAVLKAQINQERNKDSMRGHFVTVSSQKTGYKESYISEFGQLVHDADLDLPDPAGRAITQFIGHDPGRPDPSGHGVGFMNERLLENAYSDNPTEEGKEIRQQLEQHFAPVKEALRKLCGDTIELYRAQVHLKGDEKLRNVLSWTGDLQFAQHLHGDGEYGSLLTKMFPLDDIVWISDRANQIEFIMRNHRGN